MNGVYVMTLLAPVLGFAVWLVFVWPKTNRSDSSLAYAIGILGLFSVAVWMVVAVNIWGSGEVLLLLALGLVTLGLLRWIVWLLTRDPREWEASRAALRGPIGGGGNADAERRLNVSPSMLYNSRANRFEFRNRMSSEGLARAMRPGPGWRGWLAWLVL